MRERPGPSTPSHGVALSLMFTPPAPSSGRQRGRALVLLLREHARQQTPAPCTSLQCPHFGVCSGCTLDDAALIARPPLYERARAFFQEAFGYALPPPQSPPQVHHWRAMAKLAVRPDDASHPRIGLFRAGTHQVIDIPDCVVHHPLISTTVECVRRAMHEAGISAYDERQPLPFSLRYLQASVEQCTQRVQLTLVCHAEPPSADDASLPPVWQSFLANLIRRGEQVATSTAAPGASLWHSMWIHFQSNPGNAIFDTRHPGGVHRTWRQVYGDAPFVRDEPLAPSAGTRYPGAVMLFPPYAFRQANPVAFRRVIDDMILWCLGDDTESPRHALASAEGGIGVAEFCAGVGGLGQSVLLADAARAERTGRRRVRALWCSDVQGANAEAFWQAAAVNGLLSSDVADAPRIQYEEGSLEQLAARIQSGSVPCDVLLADPPRAGLGASFVRTALLGVDDRGRPRRSAAAERKPCTPQRFIYISCGFDAFVRDTQQFAAMRPSFTKTSAAGGGSTAPWRLRYARAYVLFPGSDHLEMLAVFDRKRPPRRP